MRGRDWIVLALLGASGTGKSTLAASQARQYGLAWLQVDDLRLALQYSRATLPEHNRELSWFLDNPDFSLRPPAEMLEALIGVARAMTPAVRIVIESHVATRVPMVIEGDGILPSLVRDPAVRPLVEAGAVRFCCLAAGSAAELLEHMVARGRGDLLDDVERVRRHAAANWAYDRWLTAQCETLGIPVVPAKPFATLVTRVDAALARER